MLRLTAFGGVGVRVVEGVGGTDAGELEIGRRGLALLVLLDTAPEQGLSRDSIAAYLWPESDEEHARNALRQLLHTLKRQLGLPELITGGLTLRLNPASVTSDVREFEATRAAGDSAGAVACYRGPFLDGFHLNGVPEFERWVDQQRGEYARRVASMLEALARGAREEGDAPGSAEWWRRVAALDPLNTRIAIALVETLAAAGNPAGALRHAEAHAALVRDELGATADPGLAALAARIRSGAEAPPGKPGPPAPLPGDGPVVRHPAGAGVLGERFRDRLQRELADRYVFEGEPELGRQDRVRLLRAHDRRHDRPVTLKVLHPALASQIDAERFVREIRLTGKLLHPHVLPLLDSGEVAGRPWFSMPRPEGETLRARLGRELHLPVDDALRLTRELADGLGHAHAHGIVHRDVSPENVLLARGHALLTNLGLARALDSAAGASLTDTGTLLGSPAYMSPEQAEGQGAVDGRSDQYALAAVLVEMLTGEPLFSGPTPQAIMAKRSAEPTPSPERFAGVPRRLHSALRKAMAYRPDDRFATVTAFGEALAASESSTPNEEARWWSRVRNALSALLVRH